MTTQIMCYLERAVCVMCVVHVGGRCTRVSMRTHQSARKQEDTRCLVLSPVPSRHGSLSLEVGWHQQAPGILSSRLAPSSGVTDVCMVKLSFLYWG